MSQEASVLGSASLAEPMMQAAPLKKNTCKVVALVPLFLFIGCALFCSHQQLLASVQPATNMAIAPMQSQIQQAQARAMGAAGANVRAHNFRGSAAVQPWALASAMKFAALDGARAGCRGQSACVRAVGLFFGTQAGKTEEAAGNIAEAAGLEASDIGDISAADLAGYDGIIAGVPTWHTGADEQRSGTVWDDYLEEIRGLDLCGKPVAIFGLGDQVSYGDNFCDAIEELHSTFEAAGAKMLGYTDSGNYADFTESKSVKDGKFLGLPLDGDNEPDMTEDRVKAWVEQIKGEGMPI